MTTTVNYGGDTDYDPFSDINGSPTSGVTTPPPTPPGDPASLAELQIDEGKGIALAYGRHVVAGNLIDYAFSAGPPPSLKFLCALGEGPWQGPVEVYYDGQSISSSPNATTPGYKFHPGTASTGINDVVQGTPQFFSTAPTYSETAYIEVLLSTAQSIEERPDKLKGIYDCLKVADYDATGAVTDAGSFSTNPARVAADLLRRVGLLDRIDWPSWFAWRNYCNASISWGNQTITRFECHAAFTAQTDIVTALSLVTQTGCTYWQDNGVKIEFLPVLDNAVLDPNTSTPKFTFTTSNTRGVNVVNQNKADLPTGYRATFRDLDDPYLSEVSVEYSSSMLEEQAGGPKKTEIALPPMRRSQAERICYYRTILDGYNSIGVEFIAYGDSARILPGDYVAIENEVVKAQGTSAYIALVTETEDLPETEGPSLRRIQAKLLLVSPYSDNAHTLPVT